jgi:hypothetical protein
LHPAQVLPSGVVSAGVGLSGQPVLRALPHKPPTNEGYAEAVLQDRALAPGVAPWVSARVGLPGNNEGGLTYSGRDLRLDGRHAFDLSRSVTLSAGVGGEIVLSGRPQNGASPDAPSIAGAEVDVPLLIGWTSTARIYSVWIGPRAGYGLVTGGVADSLGKMKDFDLRHLRAGLVAGLRVGFRHVHVAVEVGGDYHHVTGTFDATRVAFDQLTLTPAGAFWLTF